MLVTSPGNVVTIDLDDEKILPSETVQINLAQQRIGPCIDNHHFVGTVRDGMPCAKECRELVTVCGHHIAKSAYVNALNLLYDWGLISERQLFCSQNIVKAVGGALSTLDRHIAFVAAHIKYNGAFPSDMSACGLFLPCTNNPSLTVELFEQDAMRQQARVARPLVKLRELMLNIFNDYKKLGLDADLDVFIESVHSKMDDFLDDVFEDMTIPVRLNYNKEREKTAA